jgi:hypothetical protein
MEDRLNEYAKYLKETYKCKVYKLPVNLKTTCPNRDGNIGKGGCIFCGEEGAGFEMHDATMSIKEQLHRNQAYIKKKYKAEKFIAYFQNYSNTYLPLTTFEKYVEQALLEDIVGISIATRPDCINDEYVTYLKNLKAKTGLDISVELGLQTVNYRTLAIINRGHSLAEFLDASIKLKANGIQVCAHVILNLPWDDRADTIETAKILSALKIDFVKIHSLYILHNTELGRLYQKNEIQMITKEEYLERLEDFISYLDPNIVIQRLFGRAPETHTLFSNWGTSWWKIKDEFMKRLAEKKLYQGMKFDYLNGKAINNHPKRR